MHSDATDQLDPDEPHTPGWLTFLGIGLFLFGGIFFLATAGEEPTAEQPASQEAQEEAPEPAEGEPEAEAE